MYLKELKLRKDRSFWSSTDYHTSAVAAFYTRFARVRDDENDGVRRAEIEEAFDMFFKPQQITFENEEGMFIRTKQKLIKFLRLVVAVILYKNDTLRILFSLKE